MGCSEILGSSRDPCFSVISAGCRYPELLNLHMASFHYLFLEVHAETVSSDCVTDVVRGLSIIVPPFMLRDNLGVQKQQPLGTDD